MMITFVFQCEIKALACVRRLLDEIVMQIGKWQKALWPIGIGWIIGGKR